MCGLLKVNYHYKKCVKCGGFDNKLACVKCSQIGPQSFKGTHAMQLTCNICGYVWYEPTKDTLEEEIKELEKGDKHD